MTSTGIKYPSGYNTWGDGYFSWINPNNITDLDLSYSSSAHPRVQDVWRVVQLTTTGSSPVGDNLTDETVLDSGVPYEKIFGGESSLWGLSLSPSIINSSSFGCAFVFSNSEAWADWLAGNNYGFSIPENSIIQGVKAGITYYMANSRVATNIYIDTIGLEVFYTEGESSPSKPQYYFSQLQLNNNFIKRGAL